jgi:DNA-binding MarR family transcriptional regulator
MVSSSSSSPSLASQNYRLIHDIYVLLDAGDRRILDQFNLTTAQFRILSLLNTQSNWRLTDLSDAMLCNRSTITRIVDGLEGSGWVRRSVSSEDRRAQYVHLTQLGTEVLEKACESHLQSLELRLGGLDSDAQSHLSALLKTLYAQLSNTLHNLSVTQTDSYETHK